jgi:hypothetical protein
MKRNIAIVALVIFGLTGGAAAAAKVITSKDIRNGTIKTVDLSSNAKRALKGNTGRQGPQGPQGPQGAQGPQGPAGPNAVSKLTRVENTATVAAGDVGSTSVNCPGGQSVVSGSFTAIAADGEVFYADDFGSRVSWSVGLDNFDSLVEGDVTAIAWCAQTNVAVAAKRVDVKRKAARLERQMLAAHTG